MTPMTHMNPYEHIRTHFRLMNLHKPTSETSEESSCASCYLWDGSHQSWMIPINTGITCTYYILTLGDLTSMGTASGYIVTQDLYIVWGLAERTLENSLWFSLARYESFFLF
jgi:hypothetical protein